METTNVVQNYYLLLATGMVAVGVHAFGLFSNRVPKENSGELNSELNLVPVIAIAGRKNFSTGFLIYLAAFELIYIVLASSSTLLSLILTLANRADMVGALTSTADPDASIPIFTSTGLILLSTIRPFSRLENYIRDAAHELSGIPTNVQRIVDEISNGLEGKIEILDKQRGDLASVQDRESTEAVASTGTPASAESGTHLPNALLTANARYELLLKAGVAQNKAGNFRKSYCKVLYLHEVTLGYSGIRDWKREETNAVVELYRSIDYELEAMEALILDYTHSDTPIGNGVVSPADEVQRGAGTDADSDVGKDVGADADADAGAGADAGASADSGSDVGAHATKEAVTDPDKLSDAAGNTRKRWDAVINECVRLEQRLLHLLALLFINRPSADLSNRMVLEGLRRQAMSVHEPPMFNAFVGSALIGAFASLLVLAAYDFGGDVIKGNFYGNSPYQNKLPFSHIDQSTASDQYFRAVDGFLYGMSSSERALTNSRWMDYSRELASNLKFGTYEAIKPTLIILFAAGAALAVRARALNELQWPRDLITTTRPPTLARYVRAGMYSYAITLVVMFLYHFSLFVLIPSIRTGQDFMTSDGMELTYALLPEMVLISLMAFIVAYFVLDYCDLNRWKRDATSMRRSLPVRRCMVFAASCGFLNLMVKLSVGSVTSAFEMLDFFFIPFLSFMMFFGSFACMTWLYRNEPPNPGSESTARSLGWWPIGRVQRVTTAGSARKKSSPYKPDSQRSSVERELS